MSYFWEQFSPEDLKAVEIFRTYLDNINPSLFVSLSDRPDVYSAAESSGMDLHKYPKDGIVLQAVWVLYLMKIKSVLPPETLKYQTIHEFLSHYPEFYHIPEQEQTLLWHTANWMHELFQMIPAYKNKGLAIMIVPKLIEGWDAKYITGSGQKEVTANRVKIFENEGNVKPNSRGKQTWKSKQPVLKAKAVHSQSKAKKASKVHQKVYKPIPAKREGLRPHPVRAYDDHDVTDDENVSVESNSAVYPTQSVYHAGTNMSTIIPNTDDLIPLQNGDDDFMQALALFRQNSGSMLLGLSRANSLALSRAVSASSMFGFDAPMKSAHPTINTNQNNISTGNNAVIDFNPDKFNPPLSPRYASVNGYSIGGEIFNVASPMRPVPCQFDA